MFKNLSEPTKKLLHRLSAYRYLIIGTLIVGLFAFTVYRISYLSGPERDEAAYQAAKSSIESYTFDEAAIERILELKDAGINTTPSFPSGRNNPF